LIKNIYFPQINFFFMLGDIEVSAMLNVVEVVSDYLNSLLFQTSANLGISRSSRKEVEWRC